MGKEGAAGWERPVCPDGPGSAGPAGQGGPVGLAGPMWLSAAPALIDPAVFAKEIAADLAVLSFTRRSYQSLLRALGLVDAREAPVLPGAVEGRMDNEAAVYLSSIGAPAAGMLMEALIASGVGRILMVGAAGSLSPRCRIGDIVLPTWGVREEGTSYHYLPPGAACRPSPALLAELRTALAGMRVTEGGVWTMDSPCRETRDKVEQYAREGVLAVEMECTALMSIAMYRHIEFAAVLFISDELFGESWEEGYRTERVATTLEAVCHALPRVLGRRAPPVVCGATDEVSG
ncbi:MAG: nucleoside phosphorylase [Bacillota bacterium]|nr:nucleoside phosphorylase [Bacillota bacterium]